MLSEAPYHALDKGAVLIPAVELVRLKGAEVSSTRKGPNDIPPGVLRDGILVRGLHRLQEPPHVLKAHETE